MSDTKTTPTAPTAPTTPTKPIHKILFATLQGTDIIISEIGATWPTLGNTLGVGLHSEATCGGIMYLKNNKDEKEISPELLSKMLKWVPITGNHKIIYAITSVKKRPGLEKKAWFYGHGYIIQPTDEDFLLWHCQTLPYPSKEQKLWLTIPTTKGSIKEAHKDAAKDEGSNKSSKNDPNIT